MSLKPAVIEITAPGGISMPNLQVGKQTSFDRRWKGFWFEDLAYSQVLNDMQRQRVYEYFAMRFQVWSMNADRFDVFPFAANRTRSEDFDQESFLSQPYSGEPKELVRGSYKGDYSLSFILREQFEYEAAKAFLKQHGKSSPFIFRDYRYFPYKEVLVNRSSSLREQGSEVTYRFNYTFDVSEVDEIQAEEISPPPPPTGFHVVSTTSTSVTLDWDSDPDNLLGGGEQLLGGGEELFV